MSQPQPHALTDPPCFTTRSVPPWSPPTFTPTSRPTNTRDVIVTSAPVAASRAPRHRCTQSTSAATAPADGQSIHLRTLTKASPAATALRTTVGVEHAAGWAFDAGVDGRARQRRSESVEKVHLLLVDDLLQIELLDLTRIVLNSAHRSTKSQEHEQGFGSTASRQSVQGLLSRGQNCGNRQCWR